MGLLANGIEYGAGGAIKADLRAGVANSCDHVPNHLFEIDVGVGGDLSRDHHHPGFNQCLHGDTGVGVIFDDAVQNGI